VGLAAMLVVAWLIARKTKARLRPVETG
jgi:hypothetical protein